MDLSTILKPEAVKVVSAASSKKRLMQDISDLAAQVYGLKPEMVLDALVAREALGPTGVGHGIALPHARLDGLDEVVGCFPWQGSAWAPVGHQRCRWTNHEEAYGGHV